MIPSSRKVNKDLFGALMKKGYSYASPDFVARVFFDESLSPARFSVVVAKKLEKSAVQRNTLKRRVYSLLRPYLRLVRPGTVCALFIRKKINKKDLFSLMAEIDMFLKKSKLL